MIQKKAISSSFLCCFKFIFVVLLYLGLEGRIRKQNNTKKEKKGKEKTIENVHFYMDVPPQL